MTECCLTPPTLRKEADTLEISVPIYAGSNVFARRMMDFLAVECGELLAGAYVHGSIATGEEIAYSDFDALAILSREAERDPRAKATVMGCLARAERIMYQYDPLQHHGWFIVQESTLGEYDNSYFPYELFAYSRSLLRGKGTHLTLTLKDSPSETARSFLILAQGILRNVQTGNGLRNLYALKCMLSQLMLLPSLYLQNREGSGIYKKDSFGLAEPDFSASEWRCMVIASTIRQEWTYSLSSLRKLILTQPYPIRRIAKRFAPPIPEAISNKLVPDFFDSIKLLVASMCRKLYLKAP